MSLKFILLNQFLLQYTALQATRHAEILALEEAMRWCDDKQLEREEVFSQTKLFVTVEPCIMCAGALRIMGEFDCSIHVERA